MTTRAQDYISVWHRSMVHKHETRRPSELSWRAVPALSHDARDIEAKLLRPGPRYLISAFAEPAPTRERELAEAAKWYGLDVALSVAKLDAQFAARESDRWLALLASCAARLANPVERADLEALVRALRAVAQGADLGADLDVWERVKAHLPSAHAASAATLRGRRWLNLRVSLAERLAELLRLAADASFLPRGPREWSTFDETQQYEAIHDQLTLNGLAVIAAAPGSGKSELALSYATARRQSYDYVFWLRADDEFRLERDFLEVARRLVGRPGDPAELRCEAFLELETAPRWLLIFDSVEDPAFLMPYLPRNPAGHVLCTWAKRELDGEWMRYLSVEPRWPHQQTQSGESLLQPVNHDRARSFFAEAIGAAAASDEAEQLTQLVADSRLAAMLAAKWLRTTGAPIADYLGEWRRVAGKVDRSAPAGSIAAHVMLRELSGRKNYSGRGSEDLELHRKASTLLQRLDDYDTNTFPAEVLHVPEHSGDPIDDPRLTVLQSLGLADRSTGLPHVKYFQVHEDVFDAVRAQIACERTKQSPRRETPEEHLAYASRTLLKRMRAAPLERPLEAITDLVPHAIAIARRQGGLDKSEGAKRPLLAIELLARVAMCQLSLGRSRQAAAQILALEWVFEKNRERIRIDLHARDEEWPEVPYHELYESDQPPLRRLATLLESIRRAGPVEPAERVFDQLAPLLDDDSLDPSDRAHVYYAGGLVLRVADRVADAKAAALQAEKLWSSVHDNRWVRAARSLVAVLCIDEGNIGRARELEEATLAERKKQLAAAATEARPSAARLVARSAFLLGRISVYEGRMMEAQDRFREAIDHWEIAFESRSDGRPPGLINQIDARSNLALTRAMLGEAADAQYEALSAWREAQSIYQGREHRNTTVIRANLAQVLRLGGQVVEGADHYEHALKMSARLWGQNHRITRGVRRGCAEALLDRGLPQPAFDQILRVLRTSQGSGPASLIARARAWTVVGRLLVENSMAVSHFSSSGSEDDRELLDLAEEALARAALLFLHAAGEDNACHPEYASCLFAQAEVAIRRGRRPESVEHAYEAIESRRSQLVANQLPVLALRARCLRAQAIQSNRDLGALKSDAKSLRLEVERNWHVLAPADLLEAQIAVAVVNVACGNPPSQQTLGDEFERALKPLRAQIGDEPHQLISRAHAELSAITQTIMGEHGFNPQKQARVDRERDRARPPLDLNHIRRDVYTMLAEEEREDSQTSDSRRLTRAPS